MKVRAASENSAKGGSKAANDYGRAIADVLRVRMPPFVTFHALCGGAVFFSTLGVTIGG